MKFAHIAVLLVANNCVNITGALPSKIENGWMAIAKIYGVDLDNPLVIREVVQRAKALASQSGDLPGFCADIRKNIWK